MSNISHFLNYSQVLMWLETYNTFPLYASTVDKNCVQVFESIALFTKLALTGLSGAIECSQVNTYHPTIEEEEDYGRARVGVSIALLKFASIALSKHTSECNVSYSTFH